MSRTDEILDAIDSAVADYTVSRDAVRTLPPGLVPERAPGLARFGGLHCARVELRIDPQAAVAAFAQLADAVSAVHEHLSQTLKSMYQALHPVLEAKRQDLSRSKIEYTRRRRRRNHR